MKYQKNVSQVFLIKCIIVLFLLNPMNTADAKIESYTIEQIFNKNTTVNKRSLFKKKQTKRKKREWNTYGEKSFRMSMWVLGCFGIGLVTFGLGFIPLIGFGIHSIRLGLRSLKEKEEGIGKRKRNQGIVISIFFLLLIALVITAILIYVPVLGLIF